MRTCFLISIIFFCLLFKTSAQNRAALLSAFGQYYTCGKIDVSGTKLTIEALIKLSGSGIYDRGNPTYDDIVSKHNNPSDVNYLLRPDHCEITTSNGYYATKSGYQAFSRDSYYHVAMTYDGALLKFYVNGCLYDEVNATGNLFINNYLTTIGQLAASPTTTGYEQCYGYIDEVRIWSVVRSENDIKFNMLDLPNPTTQTGLLAYYKFEGNAKNVQGNNAYDAVPINGPTLQPQAGFAAVKPFSSSTSFQQPGCNGGDGRIVINAIGGKRPYHYSLDGINFRDSYTYDALGAGKYTVYVKTDGIGCSKMEEVTLINNTLKTNVDVNNIKCFGGSDGKIKLTGPDNRITYEYNFNKSGFQANNSFENLKSGIYSISIKNNNGCVKDTSITLTQPAALKVDALIKPDTCLNKKGAINLLVSGGTKPYIYEWKEGANQPSIMNLAPGNYSVNISDKYGCSLTKEFPVENYTPRFVVGVSPEIKTICSGDTVLLKASGGNAYIWSANNSMLNSLTATNIVFPTVTTHYKVLIKNEVCNMVDSAFSTIRR